SRSRRENTLGSLSPKRARPFMIPASASATTIPQNRTEQPLRRRNSRYVFEPEQGPPPAAASINFLTAGVGIISIFAFGFFICSRVASCCAFHVSGAGWPFAIASRAASAAVPNAERSWELAATSLTRKERCARGWRIASLSRHAVSCTPSCASDAASRQDDERN